MRKLTQQEITQLTSQGCQAQDWKLIQVHKQFDASRCQQVHFIGRCQIGDNRGERPSDDGSYTEPYRIAHARLVNCTIGDRVIIDGIRDCIAHYDVANDVVLHDIATLKVTGETAFGNGTSVEVLNETGGREVPSVTS